MTEKSMNDKIATGQAYNLAVHDAVAVGKAEDTTYILKKFLRYYDLGKILQEYNIEDLRQDMEGR